MSTPPLYPIAQLGLDFLPQKNGPEESLRALPKGSSEQDWRKLKTQEISHLEKFGNIADDWANLRVCDGFDPQRVRNCRFYGLVRIAALSPSYREHHDLRLPVGLYDSIIVSCDIGKNACIHKVGYMARVQIEENCLLFNINEIINTNHAKFGNGVVMDGEAESLRIWLEIANENGGRKILPFNGLLPSDAWLWSKYRDDSILMKRFIEMTNKIHSSQRGIYGRIGKESVIKNCRILKDVTIGEHAYLKGCNKLKNLSINSQADRPTQIGEGCELVNGIVGYGCHIFYGVKAVRFVLCDHSNLKYGARLINSVLGPNSTVSCCEVLNSLIFGSHEQHHNNSFLCASILQGQSNMASAATVGSNHNSRAADGEILAGRGFWPSLGVSLKHNSRFAAFCLIAKGSYPAELDIPFPFSLVSHNESLNELHIMPGYWFRYNLYALARNAAKSILRDQRINKTQHIEFDWLAPDTIDQMLKARRILVNWANQTPAVKKGRYHNGRHLLLSDSKRSIPAPPQSLIEAKKRPVQILHAGQAYKDYGEMILFYALRSLLFPKEKENKPENNLFLLKKILRNVEKNRREQKPSQSWETEENREKKYPPRGNTSSEKDWENVGGQLITKKDLNALKEKIRNGKIADWPSLHQNYARLSKISLESRHQQAQEILEKYLSEEVLFHPEEKQNNPKNPSPKENLKQLLCCMEKTSQFILEGIKESRRKDYENPFRNKLYDSDAERDAVLGPLEENTFIKEAEKAQKTMVMHLNNLKKQAALH